MQEPYPGMGPVFSKVTLFLSKQGVIGEDPNRNLNMNIPQKCEGVFSALMYDLMFPVTVNISSVFWLTFLYRRASIFLTYWIFC